MTENPYATPESAVEFSSRTGSIGGSHGILGIDGKKLVCQEEVKLPESCIKSARSDDLVEVRKTLYWAPGWVWILILLNLIAVLIAYFITRKKISVVYYIERKARFSLRLKTFIGFMMFILGIVGLFAGILDSQPIVAVIGGVALIAGLIMVSMFSNPLKPVAHSDGIFRLKGCCREFLEIADASII